MNAGESLPLVQHDLEIQGNRQAWQRKPLLRAVYRGFHELIASRMDRSVAGAVVELGSGMGSIKEVIPDCVTTDLFPNPWLDRQENAYRCRHDALAAAASNDCENFLIPFRVRFLAPRVMLKNF